jgi:predicted nuclease of restriction endonuclease-like (RecB) superfamily
VSLLGVENAHARAFYEAEALRGGWTSRQLDRQIQSQFYERISWTASSASAGSNRRAIDHTRPP